MRKKHAYLIIANNKYDQLSFLLKLLDNERNDFYILIDRKSSFTDNDKLIINEAVRHSNIYFVKRIPVYWGDFSLVKAELQLFSESLHSDTEYSYYHLLSGSDLPLASSDKILAFFDRHPNKIFLTYATMNSSVYDRVRYSYYGVRYNRRSGFSRLTTIPFRAMNKLSLLIQRLNHVDRFGKNKVALGYGSQWVSLDEQTVQLIDNNSEWITNTFKHSFLCDELFIPTLLNKYPRFKKKIFFSKPVRDKATEFQGNLRYINWWDGSPYTWRDGDESKIDQGINLGHLFSRKFDLQENPGLKKYILSITQK